VAVFGPLRDAAGDWIDRLFFHREFDYGRLLRALGEDLFERGDLAEQLHTALAAICRALGVRSGVVAIQEGLGPRVVATYGVEPPDVEAFRGAALPEGPQTHYHDWQPWPEARLLLPLRNPDKAKGRADQALGLLVLGAKRSGEPYRETERALLFSLGSYLALTIKHARAGLEEELAMAALAEQAAQLRAEQELLAAQAAEVAQQAAQPAPPAAEDKRGMRVYALGPLRVEREGAPIERWGGDKAGTYQAEALFAFLFDRRGRGLTKDEAEEVIWPDLDLEKADTAFHRTISALRRTLEPGLKRANESRTIAYHHERYWLDPATIAWCDADVFAGAAERGHTLLRQGDAEAARALFAEALALYRGDYMDDCPFFGDSSYVEEHRADLRDQRIDMLLALGAVYERLGQAGEAATCYRRALAAPAGACQRAEEGLARLQVGAA
jgi:DNA-binding SARP family transcriptional activator